MAIKKSDLYSSLWASCDELRGGMDASQYKDYILVLLFIKYISDKYAGQSFSPITIPPGAGFKDMVKFKGQNGIGDEMNKIIARLAEVNNLKGIIDIADFNDVDKLGSGKEMVDRLSNLIAIFENQNLDFSNNRSEDDLLVGDTFEYLIEKFAITSGRSGGGDFFTPPEIAILLAKLVEPKPGEQIYDPACGSGLLLIKSAEQTNNLNCLIYGQERDISMRALASMNLLLHNINSFHVECGDTLRSPLFIDGNQLMNFDVVVANPPFQVKNWGVEEWQNDKFGRNVAGLPPKHNGDYAWILHVISSMKNETGRAAVIAPHGVLFRSGAEQLIRKYVIENDLLDAIISLGPNLLYATGVPISILVFRTKKLSSRRGKVLLVTASTLFELKETKNKIPIRNIEQILTWYRGYTDVPGSVKVVPINQLRASGWNLNVSHYVKPMPGKLLENAIISIRLGLDDFKMGTDERIISSIRNLYAGMLLLFKEKLLRLSPTQSHDVLIKSKVIPIVEKGKIVFVGGDKNTVSFSQIQDRFMNLDINVDWQRVRIIQNKRNDIEHYYTTEKREAIQEAISSMFTVINDFIENELGEKPRELLGDKYWGIMLETSELFESQRKTCLRALQEIKWNQTNPPIRVEDIYCPSCNSSLIAPNELITAKVEDQYFVCRSCGQSTSYNDLFEALFTNKPMEEISNKDTSN